ncbi:MAG: radical SAM protein [Nitrososphaerota archaeon]|nr:radical SAM protein [Nitrososphaerota archaeon]
MQKKILVIDVAKIYYNLDFFGLGSLVVYELLKENGDTVNLYNESICENKIKTITEYISKEKFNVVCVTTRCDFYTFCISIAIEIKKILPKTYIIFGGPHATICGKETFNYPVDLVMKGAAEPIIKDVFNTNFNIEKLKKINNLIFRNNDEIVETTTKNYCEYEIKTPVKSIIKYNKYANGVVSIEVGRGCPYKCSYCVTSKFWNRTFKLRNPYQIINDVNEITEKTGHNKFSFEHDNLLVDSKYSDEIFDVIKKNMNKSILWDCSTRVDLLTEEKIKSLKDAGCTAVFLGIETGSRQMQKLYLKNIDLEKAVDNIILLNNYGLEIVLSFIIGHPYETSEDIYNTVIFALLAKDLPKCTCVIFNKLSISYGSDMYEKYQDKLYFNKRDISNHTFKKDNEIDLKLIKENKKIFAEYYSIKNEYFKNFSRLAEFLQGMINFFPKTTLYVHNKLGKSKFKKTFINDGLVLKDFTDYLAGQRFHGVHKAVYLFEKTIAEFFMAYKNEANEKRKIIIETVVLKYNITSNSKNTTHYCLWLNELGINYKQVTFEIYRILEKIKSDKLINESEEKLIDFIK